MDQRKHKMTTTKVRQRNYAASFYESNASIDALNKNICCWSMYGLSTRRQNLMCFNKWKVLCKSSVRIVSHAKQYWSWSSKSGGHCNNSNLFGIFPTFSQHWPVPNTKPAEPFGHSRPTPPLCDIFVWRIFFFVLAVTNRWPNPWKKWRAVLTVSRGFFKNDVLVETWLS